MLDAGDADNAREWLAAVGAGLGELRDVMAWGEGIQARLPIARPTCLPTCCLATFLRLAPPSFCLR